MRKEDRFYERSHIGILRLWTGLGAGMLIFPGALYGLLAHEFDCQKALQYGNATSSVKNTIPGDLPSCDLKEIDRIIRNHMGMGAQVEMER